MKILSLSGHSINKSNKNNARINSDNISACPIQSLKNDTVSFKKRNTQMGISEEKSARMLEREKQVNVRKCAYLRSKLLKECPAYIEKQFTPDQFGSLPIFNTDAKKTAEIHDDLKYFPEILIKLHTTPGYEDKLTMHVSNAKKAIEIHRALADYPDVLAQIYTTKNKHGSTPVQTYFSGATEDRLMLRDLIEKLSTDSRISEEYRNNLEKLLKISMFD